MKLGKIVRIEWTGEPFVITIDRAIIKEIVGHSLALLAVCAVCAIPILGAVLFHSKSVEGFSRYVLEAYEKPNY